MIWFRWVLWHINHCRLFNAKSIRCYHSGSEWTWEWWQWKGTPHSPKLIICLYTVYCFRVLLFNANNWIKHQSNDQTGQFSISHLFALSSNVKQSGPGSDGYKRVLHIPQCFGIIIASPLNCLISYPGHLFGWRSYPSAEIQSVYSIAPAAWAVFLFDISVYVFTKHFTQAGFSVYVFTNHSAWAGCNTKSIFKWNSAGLNSEFSFSLIGCLTKVNSFCTAIYPYLEGE